MVFRVILLYYLFIKVYANTENEFIIDYYHHKRAPSVVGFSCNAVDGNTFYYS